MLGFKVITTVSSIEKAKIVTNAGADFVINYKTQDVLNEIMKYTNNNGLDGLIDVDLGVNIAWSIDALKPNTTIATYASTRNPEMPFYQMLFKQITLRPIFVYILPDHLRRQSIDMIQKACSDNILRPLIHKIYPLEDIILAHNEVERGYKIGQILLKMDYQYM